METVLTLGLNGLMETGDVDYSTNVINASCLEELLRCPKIMERHLKLTHMPKTSTLTGRARCISKRLVHIMVYARSARNYYHFVKLIGCAAISFSNEPSICTLTSPLLKKKHSTRRRFYTRYRNPPMLRSVDARSSGHSTIKRVSHSRKFDQLHALNSRARTACSQPRDATSTAVPKHAGSSSGRQWPTSDSSSCSSI